MNSTFLNNCRTQRLWLHALLTFSFLSSSSLLAEPTQAEASAATQIAQLKDRVISLEQKLARLEKRLTDDEASRINTPAAPLTGSGDAKGQAGLGTSDEKRLASVEKQLRDVQEAQKEDQKKGETGTVAHKGAATRVTAPFEVVDASGNLVMEVTGGIGKDAYRGMKVHAVNGGTVRIGTVDPGHYPTVGVYKPGTGVPRVVMGMQPDGKPSIAILGDGAGTFTSEMTEETGNGVVNLFNPAGQPVVIIGSNPTNSEGHAKFMDAGGTPLVSLGAAGNHGDVLLGGPGKVVPVWEFMLTGFH